MGKSSLLINLWRKQLIRVQSVPGKTANPTSLTLMASGCRLAWITDLREVCAKKKQRWADLIGGWYGAERGNTVIAC